MYRNRKVWITLMSALLSALLVYGLYVLQFQRIQAEEQALIVVPTIWIEAGVVISENEMTMQAIPISMATEDMIYDMQQVIGREAIIPLGINEPVLKWKIDHFSLHPSADEATFQIPKDYIKSISNGIRAGDLVWIYTTGAEPDAISRKLFQEDIVVASVKTGSNSEVDIPDEARKNAIVTENAEQMYANRRVANGMIEYINVNLREEQWLQIDELCRNGAVKLVIAYHSLPKPLEGQMINE